uniref:hypothetical protein n=1 Tax=Candidatus Fimivicinus sp. TaxID=3056640 RepID=UPI003FEE52A6
LPMHYAPPRARALLFLSWPRAYDDAHSFLIPGSLQTFSFNDLAAISIMNEMRSFHAYLPLRPL